MSYKNNVLNGYYADYYPDETIEVQGFYADGVKNSYWTFYSDKAALIKSILYKNGLIIKTETFNAK